MIKNKKGSFLIDVINANGVINANKELENSDQSNNLSNLSINNLPKSKKISKKSQATILIILAIVIVAGILIYFVFRGALFFTGPPKDLEPVYNYYLNCIEQETQTAVAILSQQGGYIESEFSPGTVFMPFSSHLNFLGIGIPYWYYISGNGLIKDQAPSKEKIEQELGNFLKNNLKCDFLEFRESGFEIELGKEINVETKIRKDKIDVQVFQDLAISSEKSSWTGKKHLKETSSNLGKFYEIAKKIYDDFKETAFLENYTVDVLRLYAPVDGVDITCSPRIWNIEEVRENLTSALEANIPQIKIKGSYYNLKNPEHKYFVHKIPALEVDANVNFLFSREWPSKLEVWPSENQFLIAQPVGTQEGLGILGFCYVPYHFVYDLAYPVLIQLSYDSEIFQFPVVVFINKNVPRQPIEASVLPNAVPELCQNKLTEIKVSTFNTNLEPVEASIKFKCFDTTCDIGETKLFGESNEAILTENFPQCGNGFIIASSEGYETKKQIFSTISSGSSEIFLDKEYLLDLETKGSGFKNAIITFTKDKNIKTIAYPEQKTISLTQGQYEIKVYAYSDAKITLEGSSQQKCVKVASSGVLGVLGFTEEKCFTFEIPAQTIESGISGGGTQFYYLSESELQKSLQNKKLVIEIANFDSPDKIENLQTNYNKIETSGLKISFE